MAESEPAKNVAALLQQGTEIINNYDKLYREKGLKYNIFKIARISEKEVIMCRVIADLLNPKGSHHKGDAYLKLFWDIVSPKMESGIKLNTANAKIITEYSTDAQRRIDIVIDDGAIFVPIEVKIWAAEQEEQIKDYAVYSRAKNGNTHIPVLYLTVWGSEPENADAADYVCVSFYEDILEWLEQCLAHSETESTLPVKEIIKQLIGAVETICGYPEDKEMESEIYALISKSEETIRAALAINNALDNFDNEAYTYFTGAILENVQKVFPQAELYESEEEDSWSICVPLKNGKYYLYIEHDWQTVSIWPEDAKDVNSATAKKLAQKMSEFTGSMDEQWEDGSVWGTTQARYPGLEDADEKVYLYERYKQYAEHPEEAAKHIVAIANELEKA